ncbi:MAG: hypothetical protein H6825_05890 [Planctomycetes bacterium]|nr:hypothetical protein [Planctomycetota bacterium]
MKTPATSAPLVVQVGFAGSRVLFDPSMPEAERSSLEHDLEEWLVQCLEQLPERLGLGAQQFVCGISSLAKGGDTLFTSACGRLGIPQRLFLPQSREEFLSAAEDGRHDFDDDDRRAAEALFDAPHVIQERVASSALDRRDRFEDVNLELVRVSDVLICLVRAGAQGSRGGTLEVIAQARNRHRPVLVATVDVVEGRLTVDEQWHWNAPAGAPQQFVAPSLPDELAGLAIPGDAGHLPDIDTFLGALKTFTDARAISRKLNFRRAALVIVGTHVGATLLATLALKLKLPMLLGIELVLLASGLGYHTYLHRARAVGVWALTRLVSEVARSAQAVTWHMPLAHLFAPLQPVRLRSLLHTINVLHLGSRRELGPDWDTARREYIEQRLAGKKGQIPYYEGKCKDATRSLRLAHRAFMGFSFLAIVATTAKLVLMHGELESVVHSLGVAAVLLPVAAVAGLSFAASLDTEASAHVYGDMAAYAREQARLLAAADSKREFESLVLETESSLVGEPSIWFWRRSFTGVA